MWNRQNEYNDPSAQMERLKAAGLNPHMVYGNGAVGNSAGSAPSYGSASYSPARAGLSKSASPRSASPRYNPARFNAPRTDISHVPFQLDLSGISQFARKLMEFNDVRVKQAQVDNVSAQTKNIEAQTALNIARHSGVLADSEKKKVDASVAKQLENLTVDSAQHKLDLTKQQLTNSQKDELLKAAEIALKKEELRWKQHGVTEKDAMWQRQVFIGLQNLGIETNELTQKFGQWFRTNIIKK